MKEVRIESDEFVVLIRQKQMDATWQPGMIMAVDAILALGYVSKELEELRDDWRDAL